MSVRSPAEIGALWPICACGHIAQEHGENRTCEARIIGQCPTCGIWTVAQRVPCLCKQYTGPTLEEFVRTRLTPEEQQYYSWARETLPPKRTYVLSYDQYMHEQAYMSQFEGTYRQLLEHVLGVNAENREHWVFYPRDGMYPHKPLVEATEDELKEAFDAINGDGQAYLQVWCVETKERVLG